MASRNKVIDLLLSISHLPNAPDLKNAESLVNEYYSVLGHWPDELLDAAALHYKSTGTFFPTPGKLNESVLDLQMISVGIPTPGEAWSQVLGALRPTETILCEEGQRLRDSAQEVNTIAGAYLIKAKEYGLHRDTCTKCKQGGLQEIYSHPVVAETVRLLGGRDRLMTDNPAADRKQFIDAYRERVALEGRKAIMPPQVKDYIESTRANQLTAGLIKKLEIK